MATTISALNARLGLDIGQFRSGMDRARKQIRNFNRSMGRAIKRVAKLGAAAGAAAVGGLALMAREGLKAVDATAKLADQIGATTEELAGLRLAADRTGASSAKLDAALGVFQKRLGEAAQGSGQARDALQALGLSVDDLLAMSPSEQFAAVADAMDGLSTQAERNAVASDLFSRANQELVNTLALGSDGLAAAQAEAERLGLTFSRIDAAGVERANDAMARLGALVQGLQQRLAIALAPIIEAATNRLVGLGTQGQISTETITAGTESIAKGFARVADMFGFVKAAFTGFKALVIGGVGVMIRGVDKFIRSIAAIGDAIPGVEVKVKNFARNVADSLIEQAAALNRAAQDQLIDAQSGANVQAAADAFARIREETAAAVEKTREQAEANEQAAETSIVAAKAIDDQAKSLEQLERERRQQDRANRIADTIEGVEQQVRQFGLSERDRTLLELDALGATEAQLSQARAAFDRLEQLESEQDRGEDRDRAESEGLGLVRAGSAQAQLAALERAAGVSQSDREQERQTDLQTRMANSLETIERNGVGVTVEERGI